MSTKHRITRHSVHRSSDPRVSPISFDGASQMSPDHLNGEEHFSSAYADDASGNRMIDEDREDSQRTIEATKIFPIFTAKEYNVRNGRSSQTAAKQKSKRALYGMLTGLILGLGLALVHHFMNLALNGQEVAFVEVNSHLSQAWISSISTILAFLVKACFGFAITVAFVQWQWLKLHQRSVTVRDFDNITSILENVLSFCDKFMWLSVPSLTLVALISWILPLSVIVPPGTLTVVPAYSTRVELLNVPKLDYSNQSVAAWADPASLRGRNDSAVSAGDFGVIDPGSNSSFGPVASLVLSRMMFAIASTGEQRFLTSSFANESYRLDFYGPSLKCSSANESMIKNVTEGWPSSIVSPSGQNISDQSSYVEFGAFIPPIVWPYPTIDDVPKAPFLDLVSQDTSRLYVLSNRGHWNGSHKVPFIVYDPDGSGANHYILVNVTECMLYNASYTVDFNFTFPEKSMNASLEYKNLVSFSGIEPLTSIPIPEGSSPGKQLVQNYYDPAITIYASIMAGFNKFFLGGGFVSGDDTTDYIGTSYYVMKDLDLSKQEVVASTLEELFQNFTLSFFTEPSISNASLAKPVNVTVTTWPTTYVYAPRNLLIAYGLGFAATLVCSVIGIYAFLVNNGNSYQNVFSTYLRAVNNDSYLHSLLHAGDDGASPLPKSLVKVNVVVTGYERTNLGSKARSSRFWWKQSER